jgi:glycosyltransferase involved in cell wall biosynthesis
MIIVHLLASPFFGGPERQVLGLAQHLPADYRSRFLSFAEGGRARDFLDRAAAAGFEARALRHNWPHMLRAAGEVAQYLRSANANVLCTSGYKADLIGWLAARRAGIPAVAIAHGWTAATSKVRLNEALDRWVMRRFDCVIGVSEAQAERVRRAGVRPDHVVTIPNAVPVKALAPQEPGCREMLAGLFPTPPRVLVAAAGRLSPEKGFDLLIAAAARLVRDDPGVGFLIFGEGPLREELTSRIAREQLQGRFILAGFRDDVDRLLPHVDVLVLPSYTEGLPVIVLEALAAAVPVVATAVGGVPEVIEDGVDGYLVPCGDAEAIVSRLHRLLDDAGLRQRMAAAGRQRVVEEFSCTLQSQRYREVFDRLTANGDEHLSETEAKNPSLAPANDHVVYQ